MKDAMRIAGEEASPAKPHRRTPRTREMSELESLPGTKGCAEMGKSATVMPVMRSDRPKLDVSRLQNAELWQQGDGGPWPAAMESHLFHNFLAHTRKSRSSQMQTRKSQNPESE
jgi:hypothetical protein